MKRAVIAILLSIVCFSCNNVEIKKEYYSNGRVKSERQYKNGKLEGRSEQYSEGGSLLNSIHFTNDIKDTADYYYQDSRMIRVVYSANKSKSIMYKDDTGKFISFKDGEGMAYCYSYQDTIKEGDSLSFNVQSFILTSDLTGKCVVETGFLDKSNTIEDVYEFSTSSIDSAVKCKVPTKGLGSQMISGVFRFPDAKHIIKMYPFKLDFYIKPK